MSLLNYFLRNLTYYSFLHPWIFDIEHYNETCSLQKHIWNILSYYLLTNNQSSCEAKISNSIFNFGILVHFSQVCNCIQSLIQFNHHWTHCCVFSKFVLVLPFGVNCQNTSNQLRTNVISIKIGFEYWWTRTVMFHNFINL
jgi:hypothetical protein